MLRFSRLDVEQKSGVIRVYYLLRITQLKHRVEQNGKK